MPKRYSVTPRRPPGRTTFVANFYNYARERVTRSLGTDVLDEASTLCVGFVTLRNAGVRTLEEALGLKVFVSPDCFPIYFAGSQEYADRSTALPGSVISKILKHMPSDELHVGESEATRQDRINDRSALAESQRLATQNKAKLDAEQAERAIEHRSWLAQATRASANAPSLEIARKEFEKHLRGTVKKPIDYLGPVDKFLAYLNEKLPEIVNVGAIEPGHVLAFLDSAEITHETKKAIQRHNLRKLVGRFLNWAADRYGILSPMSKVKAVSIKSIRRERADIHWHALPEVKLALQELSERLKSAGYPAQDIVYWRALVSMLAFAGVQLAELCWLRLTDLEFKKGRKRATIWITTVEDPLERNERHLLKTDNRRRHVDLHPKYLIPVLTSYLKQKRAGKHFLFPMQSDRKRRNLKKGDERWRESTLSTVLRGHPGGKDKKRRPPTPGLLPAGMNAKSLRRTFGSLLIRSGKSTEEVAAAMGNTPAVVREHYARILGCEVDVDF